MELQEAKALFKLEGFFEQEDLDSFYNLEKNLLLQHLADDASEEELQEAQKRLETLERAYTLLCCELENPTDDSDANEAQPRKQQTLIAGLLLVLLGVGAYVYLGNGDAPAPKVPTKSKPAPQIAKPGQSSESADTSAAMGNPQEQRMLALQKQADALKIQWEDFAQQHGFPLSASLAETLEEAAFHKKQDHYSQASMAYQDFISGLQDHHKKMRAYVASFGRYDKLRQQWQQLARQHEFAFSRDAHYLAQFQQVKTELQSGELPSYSQPVLNQVCFIYEGTIKRGQDVARLRREYKQLKARWEKQVLNSAYYQLTPSIAELIETADQTTYFAEDFEYLQSQVFPRLLNHFKQHLG